jgi:glutathione S-transferase
MSITFYYASGSPFSWKVWLALEHKRIPYELKLLSFDRGDLRKPEYLAINPRGKVPAIVDGDFTLWESTPIVEYLEERYPENPILPKDIKMRARARRVAGEADAYLYPASRRFIAQALPRGTAGTDAGELVAARAALVEELARFERALDGDWFAGALSLADLSVYPILRLIRRVDERKPELGLGDALGARLSAFIRRIDALPYVDKTTPPHWRT